MAAGVMVAGGAYQYYMSRKAGKMQMEIAKMNAGLAQEEAQFIIDQAEWEVGDKRKEIKSLMATQRSRAAASGVAITSKSVVNVVLETVTEGEEDVFRIRQRAQAGAYSKRMEAAGMIFQGRIARAQAHAQGDQALVGSMMSAGSYYQSPTTSSRASAGAGQQWYGFGAAQQQADNPTY
jgi:hypothetical protein